MSLSDVARESGLALPNVSTAIKALITDGLAEKIDTVKSKRIYAVRMTKLGRKICDDFLENYLSKIDMELHRGLTEEESAINRKAMQIEEQNA